MRCRPCKVCGTEFDPELAEPPGLTCSPECLQQVSKRLAELLPTGEPGRAEVAAARRLALHRYPPSWPHHWMARGALVLAGWVDADVEGRWPMLRHAATLALDHATSPPGPPGSMVDQIRATLVLSETCWCPFAWRRP